MFRLYLPKSVLAHDPVLHINDLLQFMAICYLLKAMN